VSGRWSSDDRRFDQPPRTAGDHPDFPVERFSQRVAYTSDRAPNSERSNATFSASPADASTTGRSAGSDNSVGAHARRCPSPARASKPSSPRSRAFSSRSSSTVRASSSSLGRRTPPVTTPSSQDRASGATPVPAVQPICSHRGQYRPCASGSMSRPSRPASTSTAPASSPGTSGPA